MHVESLAQLLRGQPGLHLSSGRVGSKGGAEVPPRAETRGTPCSKHDKHRYRYRRVRDFYATLICTARVIALRSPVASARVYSSDPTQSQRATMPDVVKLAQ